MKEQIKRLIRLPRSLILLCKTFFIVAFSFFFSATPVFAIVNPNSVANNRFGIHILQRDDIKRAAELVNSSGGEWGYVTLVIQENDRDIKKWQEVLDELRRAKLIPIVRIATSPIGAIWRKPTPDDASGWADFLGSLRWVVKNRYIILFNEPNHAKEWQGTLSPTEYSQVARAFATKLNEKSDDFFVLPAGLDVSAPNSRETMEATNYWKAMHKADPELFTLFDGWTSHSYPNPQFSADPFDVGKHSIRSYQGEVSFAETLGLARSAPIFITETGWIHKEGINDLPEAFDAEALSSHFEKAYSSAWNDARIVAVTPFVLHYTAPPFDHFSWIKPSGEPYPFFSAVQKIPKKRGEPTIPNSFSFEKDPLPGELLAESMYDIEVFIKNTGLAIWEEGTFAFKDIPHTPSPYLEPGQIGKITITLATKANEKEKKVTLLPLYKGSAFGDTFTKTIKVQPPTSLKLEVKQFPKVTAVTADDFTLVIYDGVRFIKEIRDISFEKGVAKVFSIHDLIPGQEYRFVLTHSHYLPVQKNAHLDTEESVITFPKMLPVDFNKDGAFSANDVLAAILHPLDVIRLWLPF